MPTNINKLDKWIPLYCTIASTCDTLPVNYLSQLQIFYPLIFIVIHPDKPDKLVLSHCMQEKVA